MTTNAFLDAALSYAARGWRAVPLVPGQKYPAGPYARDWPEKATTDEAVIRREWDREPDGNVGVALGSRSGIVAIDVDTEEGAKLLLELTGGNLPPTCEMTTGKGSRLLFAIPDHLEFEPKQKTYSVPGPPDPKTGKPTRIEILRFQGKGGQCVMPPSIHPGDPEKGIPPGRVYTWVEGRSDADIEPAPMTPEIIAVMTPPPPHVEPEHPPESEVRWADPRTSGPADAFAPGSDFNLRGDWWADVLAPAGFSPSRPPRDQRGTWRFTRPGKSDGSIGATVGYYKAKDGTPALYVFSGSIPALTPGNAYDKFGAFTRLHCRGDFSAAASALAAKGFGRPRPPRPSASAPPAEPQAAGGPPPPPQPPWRQGKQVSGPPKGITASALVALEFDPPRFLVSGLLTEGLTILAGRPKHGKSWLSLLLGWAVAAGSIVDGRDTIQGEVLYLALEDTRRRLQSRLTTLRESLGWVVPETLTLQTSWARASDGGLGHVADWAEQRRGSARLVIVDTLAKFRDVPKGSGGASYSEDYQAVGGLKELLDHYSLSGLVVTHTRKLKAEDPFDEVSGTLGVGGAADSIWVLDTSAKGSAARLYATGRDLPDCTTPLSFDAGRWTLGTSASGIDLHERGAAAPGGPGVKRVDAAKDWLRSFLSQYAYPANEVDKAGRAAGHAPSAIRDAKAQLGRQGTGEIRFSKNGGGEWWIGMGPMTEWRTRPSEGPVPD